MYMAGYKFENVKNNPCLCHSMRSVFRVLELDNIVNELKKSPYIPSILVVYFFDHDSAVAYNTG